LCFNLYKYISMHKYTLSPLMILSQNVPPPLPFFFIYIFHVILCKWSIFTDYYQRFHFAYFVIKLLCVLSGLDAFQAEKVMETLQQLAQDGHTVICSIHQPRGSVYSKFDDIILLTEGSLAYAGPAHQEPLTYFSKFGLAS